MNSLWEEINRGDLEAKLKMKRMILQLCFIDSRVSGAHSSAKVRLDTTPILSVDTTHCTPDLGGKVCMKP